jgi:hypothetical protein
VTGLLRRLLAGKAVREGELVIEDALTGGELNAE